MPITIPLTHTPKFKAEGELNESTKTFLIRMSGTLDETVDLVPISAYVGKLGSGVHDLCLHLGGLNSINSSGVRSWMILIERLQKNNRRCTFTFLSEAFLEKASPYPSMLGEKINRVIEFEAPYFCPRCKERSLHSLKTSDLDLNVEEIAPPVFNCKKCSKPMDFDDIPEDYFAFLRRLPKI